MPGIFGTARFKLPDGRQFPSSYWRTASSQQLSALGFRIYTPPEPEPVEPTEPKFYTVNKTDLWKRCTEDEAEILQAALAQASAKMQGVFNGATVLHSNDEFFPMLQAGISDAVGEERANEILAPSEG